MTDNEKYFREKMKGFWIGGSLTIIGGVFLFMDYIYPGESFKLFRDLFVLMF